jgi:hypothetical protein
MQAKFTDLRRLRKVGSGTLLGASGEYSDFQYIMDLLDEIVSQAANFFAYIPALLHIIH